MSPYRTLENKAGSSPVCFPSKVLGVVALTTPTAAVCLMSRTAIPAKRRKL